MGAATALYYMNRTNDLSVKVLVLDSPYDDLEKIAKGTCENHTDIPNFLISLSLSVINIGTKWKADVDIRKLKPIKFVHNLDIPAFFIAGTQDQTIPLENVQNLFNHYKGKRALKFINQDHNEHRSEEIIDKAKIFLLNELCSKTNSKQFAELKKAILMIKNKKLKKKKNKK